MKARERVIPVVVNSDGGGVHLAEPVDLRPGDEIVFSLNTIDVHRSYATLYLAPWPVRRWTALCAWVAGRKGPHLQLREVKKPK